MTGLEPDWKAHGDGGAPDPAPVYEAFNKWKYTRELARSAQWALAEMSKEWERRGDGYCHPELRDALSGVNELLHAMGAGAREDSNAY